MEIRRADADNSAMGESNTGESRTVRRKGSEESIRNEIKYLLKQSGLTATEMSRKINRDKGYISEFLNKKKGSIDASALNDIKTIADARICELNTPLLHNSGPGVPDGLESASISSVDDDLRIAHRDVILEADVRSGAGGGGVRSEENIVFDRHGNTYAAEGIAGEWSLPKQVMTGMLRAAPQNILAFEVIGDSMEPRLKSGDRVFVDRRMTYPNPEGIFVLWDGYSIVVKQLQIVRGSDPLKLRVISANPQYEAYEVLAEEANIIGRFVGRFTAE